MRNVKDRHKKNVKAREKDPDRPLSMKERVALRKAEPGFVKRAIREAKDRSADKELKRTMDKRNIHKERWDDICGGPYTLDHPVVSLEYKMCEYRFLAMLMAGNREKAFEELTPEEIDVYLNGYPELGIGPYTSVEESHFAREAWVGIKRHRNIKVELCEAHQDKSP